MPLVAPAKRIADKLALKRSIVGLMVMVILCAMGEKMSERYLPIYLIALGAGPQIIGLYSALDNLLSALYSFPGGYLAHRFGTKRALLIFNLMAMAGYVLVIIIRSWWGVLLGACLFCAWTAISLPATMGIVAAALPKNRRTMGVSMNSIIKRVPMSLGPLGGGILIDRYGMLDGMRYAFMGALGLTVIALLLQQVMIPDDSGGNTAAPAQKNPFALLREMSPALRDLLVSDILVRFCEQIPSAFVVVWCMYTIVNPVSGKGFAALTTIEMATAVLCYIPVAYFADRTMKKPFVVTTFAFFTAFPLVLLFCHSFWALVPAFIVRGLKEFGEPTRKALIMDLAPEDKKAAMFGTYYLARDTIVSLAALGGAYLWIISPTVNFLSAFGFGVIGTLWLAFRRTEA